MVGTVNINFNLHHTQRILSKGGGWVWKLGTKANFGLEKPSKIKSDQFSEFCQKWGKERDTNEICPKAYYSFLS